MLLFSLYFSFFFVFCFFFLNQPDDGPNISQLIQSRLEIDPFFPHHVHYYKRRRARNSLMTMNVNATPAFTGILYEIYTIPKVRDYLFAFCVVVWSVRSRNWP